MRRSAVVVFSLALSAPLRADDLTPPTWRGSSGTTFQHWDFSSGAAGGAPDGGGTFNPYGTPNLAPGFGATWQATGGGRSDVWSMPGVGWLNFGIPNTGVATHQKELWLQVTYLTLNPPRGPLYFVTSRSTGRFTLLSSQITALPGGWTHELTRWSSSICPRSEIVAIAPVFTTGGGPSVLVDQVVIDTICIPAPAPAALLALSFLVCSPRRRCKKVERRTQS